VTDSILTRAQVHALASAASTAPSIHNSQPWRLQVIGGGRVLRMYGDLRRNLPAADPDGRALHLSVGAALLNLRVAAAHLGWSALVRLIPDASDPLLLAGIDLSPAKVDDPWEFSPGLYPAIWQRHSSRQPFSNRDVPETVLGALMTAAHREGTVLVPLEEDGALTVMALTRDADRRNAADPVRQREERSWLRLDRYAPDGIPRRALGPRDTEARVPMRSFAGGADGVDTGSERFEALPQLAVLATGTDRPTDWLRAGQAMERAWLVATAYGLRASVFHQALEWPDTRRALNSSAVGPGFVQTVLRLGYGPPGPPTPRRTAIDVLVPGSDSEP
jgi:nitroreductase